jgi:hypothetical protein
MDSSRDREPLCGPQDNLMAVVCEGNVDVPVPVFSIKRIKELADHLEQNLPRQQKRMRGMD